MPSIYESRNLGLNDPKFTTYQDRGETEYNQRNPPCTFSDLELLEFESKPDFDGADDDGIISIIKSELDDNGVYYPTNSHSSFYIPRAKLRDILTPGRIRQIINQLSCCNHLSSAQRRDLCLTILSPNDAGRQCWKLLAVLIKIGKQEQLLHLMEKEGVSDRCLPFKVPAGCQIEDHHHPTLDSWPRPCRCEASRWSYALKAPYFTQERGKHNHYVLDDNDVLPVSETVERERSTDPHNRQEAINSGFSEVQIVKLDESHFYFEDAGPWNHDRGPRLFAQKQLYSTDQQKFNVELAALLKIQDYNNKHLIKLVATFEIRKAQGTTYHFLFPCAQGDLWVFWELHQADEERLSRAPWMAQQIHCLAEALRLIHNEEDPRLRFRNNLANISGKNGQSIELYGCHGDMKAENILWFEEDKGSGADWGLSTKEWLAITDFGLGRLNSKYSRSGIDPKSVTTTVTYKAPEFDTHEGTLSRVSDIFSFGCICLEFVTWYLMGWKAVSEEFPEAREEWDPALNSKFALDTFFRIERRSGSRHKGERAIIKPQVKEWIEKLRASEHSTCYTLQFLELIERRMLEIDPEKRIKSDKLVAQLKLLADTCERSPSFYQDRCNSLLPPVE